MIKSVGLHMGVLLYAHLVLVYILSDSVFK